MCCLPGTSGCENCLSVPRRPTIAEFKEYLEWFLLDNPGVDCAAGGHAAFGDAVKLYPDNQTIESMELAFYSVYR